MPVKPFPSGFQYVQTSRWTWRRSHVRRRRPRARGRPPRVASGHRRLWAPCLRGRSSASTRVIVAGCGAYRPLVRTRGRSATSQRRDIAQVMARRRSTRRPSPTTSADMASAIAHRRDAGRRVKPPRRRRATLPAIGPSSSISIALACSWSCGRLVAQSDRTKVRELPPSRVRALATVGSFAGFYVRLSASRALGHHRRFERVASSVPHQRSRADGQPSCYLTVPLDHLGRMQSLARRPRSAHGRFSLGVVLGLVLGTDIGARLARRSMTDFSAVVHRFIVLMARLIGAGSAAMSDRLIAPRRRP